MQNFPDVSFLAGELSLTSEMDMVRQVCSTALFIRDQKNLRVRLPLNKLTIIGKNAAKMLQYKDIIADEVNVKNIEIIEEIGDLAELKLQINFKKVGAKLSSKMKEITIAAKENNWKKLSDNQIEIAGETLNDDEFEIKLITKNQNTTSPLATNDCLVELDIVITKELEEEGLARDIVRAIQQNRKDANLDVSNHIKIVFYSNEKSLLEVIKNYQKYLQEQTLADQISIATDSSSLKTLQHYFQNKVEGNELEIGFDVA